MSQVTFDGPNKLIIVDNAVTELDAKVDLYSDWKEWVLTSGSDNAKFLPAFRTTGGDVLPGGQYVSGYYFLANGWRIRPYEGDHGLSVVGNLFVDGGGNPFVPTLGDYTVLVNVQTSANSLTTIISGSDGGGGGLTDEEHNQLMSIPLSNLALADTIEGGISLQDWFRIGLAFWAGESDGGGTTRVRFYSQDGQVTRIDATVSPSTGNRSAVALDTSGS
jgi:hypothetical protein